MGEQRAMKDGLNRTAIERIAGALDRAAPGFAKDAFIERAITGLDRLELKQRVQHVIEVLGEFLPKDFKQTAAILSGLAKVWDKGDPADSLRGFAAWPLIDFVAVHGLDEPETALPVLRELTPLFTAEFAIRPFIQNHLELTLTALRLWSLDENEAVRRLVSEGTRPRLPWGARLDSFVKDPSPVLPLLEKLKDDPSESVRRSVANHLNDIGKDHPELLLDLCERWSQNASSNRKRLIRHAVRSLVKQGRPRVFPLLGYDPSPKIEIGDFSLSPGVLDMGGTLSMNLTLQSRSDREQSFVLDYVIDFVKANGKTAPKVFKWRNVVLPAGSEATFTKTHTIKPITTRVYYPGRHKAALLINGVVRGDAYFLLNC